MTSVDVLDTAEMDPLLAEHRAALFELRENLERLKKLIDREEDLAWAEIEEAPSMVALA